MSKQVSYYSVEFWTRKGFSAEEAKKLISKKSRENSVWRIEHWMKYGFTEDQAKEKVSEIQKKCSSRCVEHWIAKGFSEEEAKQKVSEIQSRHEKASLEKHTHEERQESCHFSPAYWVKHGMSENEAIAFCKQRSDGTSLHYFVSRFGEKEGSRKYNELCTYRKKNYTLEGYKEKHGDSEGESLWCKKFKIRDNSMKANQFFTELFKCIPSSCKVYYAGSFLGEYGIRNGNNYYFCDFVVPELSLCIEFYGDYWHCNPEKYQSDFLNSQERKTAQQIWDYDKARIEAIRRKRNFDVFVVWEKDRKEKLEEMKKIVSYRVKYFQDGQLC
ncbi:Uncharacterised protein [uncultured archaeon]|nr:Uncharacterised protein [uncultured archaeon]